MKLHKALEYTYHISIQRPRPYQLWGVGLNLQDHMTTIILKCHLQKGSCCFCPTCSVLPVTPSPDQTPFWVPGTGGPAGQPPHYQLRARGGGSGIGMQRRGGSWNHQCTASVQSRIQGTSDLPLGNGCPIFPLVRDWPGVHAAAAAADCGRRGLVVPRPLHCDGGGGDAEVGGSCV